MALFTLPLLAGLALLVVPFLLVARATSAVARWLSPETTPFQDLVEYVPEIGWRPKPGLAVHGTDDNGDPFWLTTDADGWRGQASIAESDVIVFGDSFAFGFGADERDFFGAGKQRPRIKGIGAPGYNMVQSLMWMRRLGPQLRGKTVAWLIYSGNDLEDNLNPQMESYRAPFVRETWDGDWQIVTAHVGPHPWPFWPRRTNAEGFLELCRPSLLATRAYRACDFLIEAARELSLAHGARLVVITVPDLSPMQTKTFARLLERAPIKEFDPAEPDRRIRAICARLGVPFIALADSLNEHDYLNRDVHWNRRGHERVAQILRDAGRMWTPSHLLSRATPDPPSVQSDTSKDIAS
jgi:hypothetical protein